MTFLPTDQRGNNHESDEPCPNCFPQYDPFQEEDGEKKEKQEGDWRALLNKGLTVVLMMASLAVAIDLGKKALNYSRCFNEHLYLWGKPILTVQNPAEKCWDRGRDGTWYYFVTPPNGGSKSSPDPDSGESEEKNGGNSKPPQTPRKPSKEKEEVPEEPATRRPKV